MNELGKKINNWMNKERNWNSLSSVTCTRLDQDVLTFHFLAVSSRSQFLFPVGAEPEFHYRAATKLQSFQSSQHNVQNLSLWEKVPLELPRSENKRGKKTATLTEQNEFLLHAQPRVLDKPLANEGKHRTTQNNWKPPQVFVNEAAPIQCHRRTPVCDSAAPS